VVSDLDKKATDASSPRKPRQRISRRKFLLAGGLAAGGLAAYSTLLEPNVISLEQVTLRVKSLPPDFEGFRIALISDLHFAPFTGATEIGKAVARINELRPDLVAAVGDFVTDTSLRSNRANARFAEPCAAVLANLRSQVGTVAVLGNHDHVTDPKFVAGALKEHGIRVLRNENFYIERGTRRLWIAGIDDALKRAADVNRSISGIPAGELIIALVHEPDVADTFSKYPIALQLSGHSHGGQVRMPGVGALYLPPLGQKYPAGLYHIAQMQLYTTRGIGMIGIPVRFDCPPEVTLITLKAPAA
jgi:predicted MPP superfamily phosphohydrolase